MKHVEAEEALGEVPRGAGQRSLPRLIQRLEEAEKKLKDQYKRMYEAYTQILVDVDMKSEEEEQVEALHKKAEDRHKVVMGELKKVLDGNQAADQGSNQGQVCKSMKIEEVLNPI